MAVTQPGQLTPQGSQVYDTKSLMSSLVAQNPAEFSQYATDLTHASQMKNSTPQWLDATRGQLQGAAQIPQIANQYGSLATAYGNTNTQQNVNSWMNPAFVTGGQGAPAVFAQTPYGPLNDYIPSLTTSNVGDFKGFADPGLAQGMNSTQLGGIAQIANSLNNLLSYNSGQVSSGTAYDVQARQTQIQDLIDTGNLALQMYQAAHPAVSGGGGGGSNPSQDAAVQYQSLKEDLAKQLGRAPTEYEIWKYIQDNRTTLAAQGLDMATIDKLEKSDAQRFGVGNKSVDILGYKSPKPMSITSMAPTKTNKNPGWTIKLGDGSTKKVLPDPGSWFSGSKTKGKDPQQIMDYGHAHQEDDQTILQALEAAGFTVQ